MAFYDKGEMGKRAAAYGFQRDVFEKVGVLRTSERGSEKEQKEGNSAKRKVIIC